MSRQIVLGDELDRAVDELVRTGRFRTREEVLKAGVELLREREALRRDVDDALASGLADADANRVSPLGDVFGRLERKLQRRTGR